MTDGNLRIVELNRYPVKGLSAETMDRMILSAGEGIPGDRLFGFARYNSGFDPQDPQPLPKDRFVVLLKEAGLAGLKTRFDAATHSFEIASGGTVRQFDMNDTEARLGAAQFLHETLQLSDPEPPVFVSSAPHRFTDVSVVSPQMMSAISVLNLASVRDMESRIGARIDPARFRANIVIDGLPPFAELDAIGSVLAFGGISLRILSRTKRCAATEVNPETAERDLNIPYLLRKHLGHMDMGVYVEVAHAGTLRISLKGKLSV